MNAQRRKTLNDQIGKLEEIKATIETEKDAEQETFDNMPENLQGSNKGVQCEEAISLLEEVISGIDDAISNIENSIQ